MEARRLVYTQPWPLPEALAFVVLAAGAAVAWLKAPSAYHALLGLVYLALVLAMAVYDIRSLRVPNRLVYPALLLGVIGPLALGVDAAQLALLGGVAAFVITLGIAVAGRGAMGFADVKVACFCGIVVGWPGVVPMLVLSFIASAAVALPLVLSRRYGRKDALPFVPFLAGATVLSMSAFQSYLWS